MEWHSVYINCNCSNQKQKRSKDHEHLHAETALALDILHTQKNMIRVSIQSGTRADMTNININISRYM
jgi:hypothetical protein